MYKILNDKYLVEVDNKAAEVHTFKRIDEDYNYVWCGDPSYWSQRNPILFPQVGSTSDKSILIDGVRYKTGNHGFARYEDFKLVELKDDELSLELSENENTLSQYPFKFALLVNYKLSNNRLDITYTITNNDDKLMPYGFGLHPAFACAHDYEDTEVIFNKEEDDCKDRCVISKEFFNQHSTLVINNPKSDKATLRTKDRKISIEYPNFKIFAIWSKGDFVCLEPWMNCTADDPNVELKDRENIEFLDKGESREIKYSWIIEE